MAAQEPERKRHADGSRGPGFRVGPALRRSGVQRANGLTGGAFGSIGIDALPGAGDRCPALIDRCAARPRSSASKLGHGRGLDALRAPPGPTPSFDRPPKRPPRRRHRDHFRCCSEMQHSRRHPCGLAPRSSPVKDVHPKGWRKPERERERGKERERGLDDERKEHRDGSDHPAADADSSTTADASTAGS